MRRKMGQDKTTSVAKPFDGLLAVSRIRRDRFIVIIILEDVDVSITTEVTHDLRILEVIPFGKIVNLEDA